MQMQEGVKVVFGGDAAGLLTATNAAKGAVAGLVTFSVAKMAEMDRAARRTQREWERSLTEISTLANFSTKEIEAMRREMAQLSVASGQAFDKMARARYDVISAGFADAADSAMVLEAASKGAVGGLTDISVSAKALVTILNAYELEARDAAKVNDLLFTTVQQGVTTYGELASEIGEVASTAKAANVPLQDLLALVATVTRGGISTPEAVTAINQFLLAFIKQGPDAQRITQAFGLDVSNLAETMQTMAVMGERDLEMLAKLVPSVRGLKAALAGAAQDGERFRDVLAAMGGAEGAGDAAAGKMADTYSQAMDRAAAATDRLAAAWGRFTAGADQAVIEDRTRAYQALAAALENMHQKGMDAGNMLFLLNRLASGDLASVGLMISPQTGSRGPAANEFSTPGSGVIAPGGGAARVEQVTASQNAARWNALNFELNRARMNGAGQIDPVRGGTYGGRPFAPPGGQPYNLGGRSSAWNTGGSLMTPQVWADAQISGTRTDTDQQWMDAQRKVQMVADLGEATLGNLSNVARAQLGTALGEAFGAGESALGQFAAQALADLSMIIMRAVVLRGILSAVGLGGVADLIGLSSGGYAPGFAWGGYTGGAIDRHKPAGVVHAGEYVLNQEAVKRIGVARLDRMNRGGDTTVNVGGVHINGTSMQSEEDIGRATADSVVRALRKSNRTGAARLATGFGR